MNGRGIFWLESAGLERKPPPGGGAEDWGKWRGLGKLYQHEKASLINFFHEFLFFCLCLFVGGGGFQRVGRFAGMEIIVKGGEG